MNSKASIKLDLAEQERLNLRKHKIRKMDILQNAADELAVILDVSEIRAKSIHALADFQRIPSIGIEFAKDMIFLGFYNIGELKERKGAELLDLYEKRKGYMTDSCVEDQFRLAVDFAKNSDDQKKWWDFTSDRKTYRAQEGYPADRPIKFWTEVPSDLR